MMERNEDLSSTLNLSDLSNIPNLTDIFIIFLTTRSLSFLFRGLKKLYMKNT